MLRKLRVEIGPAGRGHVFDVRDDGSEHEIRYVRSIRISAGVGEATVVHLELSGVSVTGLVEVSDDGFETSYARPMPPPDMNARAPQGSIYLLPRYTREAIFEGDRCVRSGLIYVAGERMHSDDIVSTLPDHGRFEGHVVWRQEWTPGGPRAGSHVWRRGQWLQRRPGSDRPPIPGSDGYVLSLRTD